MRRLFSADVSGDRVTLDAEQARHARKVLRLRDGDAVELFDGSGAVAAGRLRVAGKASAVAIEHRRQEQRPTPWVELAVAMPKGARADVLVEKVSELGADRVIPLRTERSVVEVGEAKEERLRRMAVESAKQSGRAYLMEIGGAQELGELLLENKTREGLRLIADPNGLGTIGAAQLLGTLDKVERVIVLIGPEGGWTEDEREAAWEAGFVPWRMGPYTLRVETAAMAATALCRQVT